jgi:PhzF family phenazine biosynthesis protein
MGAPRTREFLQVDVFADRPGAGNGLAVVLDADDMDAAAMQAFATWTNLSETAFVLAPDSPGATYRVRIFTPRSELPFAGHPSVGTAHALLEAGRITAQDGRLVQQCAAGDLPLQVTGSGADQVVAVRAPRAREIGVDSADRRLVQHAIPVALRGSLAPALVANGPRFWCVQLVDEDAVRSLAPDLDAIAEATRASDAVGLAVFAESATGDGLVVRVFCPADGIPEDPVTGAANAAIGGFLYERGALGGLGSAYAVSQGREVGRDGRIEVRIDADGEVWIGGRSRTVLRGTVTW